jgi:CRP-like cAMP-binding protein
MTSATKAMASTENQLIERLPQSAREKLLDQCEPFELVLSAELSVPGRPLSHAYFPRGGFVSLVVGVDRHLSLEVGMVGREAMLGAELILGAASTPWRALVQGAGASWRIGAAALRTETATNFPLLRLLQASVLVRLHQQATASACERYHTIRPRLARWLLMSQDRAGMDCFHVTQEFLALMLGVRRVGVTEAANELRDSGLISYRRGEMTVLDRPGMQAQACSCYAADKAIYTELMGDAKPL